MTVDTAILQKSLIKSGGFVVLIIFQLFIHIFFLIFTTFSSGLLNNALYVVVQLIFWIGLCVWFVPFTYWREVHGQFEFRKEIKEIKNDQKEIYNILEEIKEIVTKND